MTTFRPAVDADAGTHLGPIRLVARYVVTPSVSASVLLRGSEALLRRGHTRTSWLLRARLANKHGIHVAQGARIGSVRLPHPSGIVIGPGAVVGNGVAIYQGVTLGAAAPRSREWEFPTVEDDVTIYANAVVVGPVTIGRGATIGAGAIVTKSVPAGATVIGTNRIVLREPTVELAAPILAELY